MTDNIVTNRIMKRLLHIAHKSISKTYCTNWSIKTLFLFIGLGLMQIPNRVYANEPCEIETNNSQTFTIRFLDSDSLEIKSLEIDIHTTFTAPQPPLVVDQFFVGWQSEDGTLWEGIDGAYHFDQLSVSQDYTFRAIYQNNTHPQVGDYYQGGTVFYILEPGDYGYEDGKIKGLIAAVTDLEDGTNYCWGTYQNSYIGLHGNWEFVYTSKKIGTGAENTQKIIDWLGVPKSTTDKKYYYAAYACSQWKNKGFIDWYLPALNECIALWDVRQMVDSISIAHGGKAFTTTKMYGNTNYSIQYWTSSEYSSTAAYNRNFSDMGGHLGVDKMDDYYFVRPIRTFEYQRKYQTVTFRDHDQKRLGIDSVDYSYSATPPSAPTQKGHTFTGWSSDLKNIVSDTVLYAQYSINHYPVSFLNYDETLLDHINVEYNKEASAPQVPHREGYTFSGWDKALSHVKDTLVLTAQFRHLTRPNYTVRFFDRDDQLLSTQIVAKGDSATLPPPPSYSDAFFKTWSNHHQHITCDLDITAHYQKHMYQVIFKDWNNTILDTQMVYHGAAAKQILPTLNRTGYRFTTWSASIDSILAPTVVNAQYEKDPNYTPQIGDYYEGGIITNIYKDAYSNTHYNEADQFYGVICYPNNLGLYPWEPTGLDSYSLFTTTGAGHGEYNTKLIVETFGTEPSTQYAALVCEQLIGNHFDDWFLPSWGDMNSMYNNLEMINEALENYGGTPIEAKRYWTSSGSGRSDVSSSMHMSTYFDRSISDAREREWAEARRFQEYLVRPMRYFQHPKQTCTVTFVDWQGDILSQQTIYTGQNAITPLLPKQDASYTFRGWDQSTQHIEQDVTIAPIYTHAGETVHTVVFCDRYGDSICSQKVIEGEAAIPPFTSHVSHDGFLFTHWELGGIDINHIYQDEKIFARYYYPSDRHFNVWFKDYDHTFISTSVVEKGDTALPPSIPQRPGYTFIGWFTEDSTQIKDFGQVDEHLYLYAHYQAVDHPVYRVRFFDWNGLPLSTQYVDEHQSPQMPEVPERLGYTFTSWDQAFTNVSSDMDISPQYQPNVYTITYKDLNENTIHTDNVKHGAPSTPPTEPQIEGYTFQKWDTLVMQATNDVTIYALYTKNQNTVMFKNWDGTILQQSSVQYNNFATEPEQPTRKGYSFTGWNMDPNTQMITERTIFTAQFESNLYTVTFIDKDGTQLSRQLLKYGSAATAPAYPVFGEDHFLRWDQEFQCIDKDMTIQAIYDQQSAYDFKTSNELKIYPNPVTDNRLYVKGGWSIIECILPTGQSTTIQVSNGTIDLSGFSAGVYIMKANNQCVKVIKK